MKLPFSTGHKMSTKDMILLLKSLSYMLSAGLSIREGVEIIRNNKDMRVNPFALELMQNEFDAGLTLSEVFHAHESVFGSGLWQQIEAAERTGRVADALLRIGTQLQNNKDLMARIRGAMAYPMFILVTAIVAGFYLFLKTIPEMGQMMMDLGGELPPLTVAMMALCDFLLTKGLFVVIGVVLLVLLIIWALTHPLRTSWHKFISKAPISGQISVNTNYARAYQMVNDMIANGSNTVDALRVAASTLSNLFIAAELFDSADTMEREGYAFNEALSSATRMPNDDKLMLDVGVRTGREMEMLQDMASRRMDAANESVNTLLELMTPIIMIGVILIVGVIVVAVYLPMLTLASSVM